MLGTELQALARGSLSPPAISLPLPAARSISSWHALLSSHTSLPFFLLWTTPSSTFSHRQRAVVEQLLLFHPTSPVVVLSNTLPLTFFDAYRAANYDIQVRTYGEGDLQQMCHGDSGILEWVRRIDEWRSGPWFFSHITDFMRFSLLYEHGGSYLDFDAMVLRPWSGLSSAVGQDQAGGRCSWCLPNNVYIAPGVMINLPPKSPLMLEALRNGFAQPSLYDPECFVCVGPRALTVAVRAHLEADVAPSAEFPVDGVLHATPLFTILDSFQLYPVNYQHILPMLQRQPHAYETWSKLRRRALSLHLFGKVTMNAAIEPGSVVDIILRDARLTCPDDTSERSKLHISVAKFIELASSEPHETLRIPDVRLTDCAHFDRQADARYRLTLAVQRGELLTFAQSSPSSRLQIVGTVREINSQLTSLVYVSGEAASETPSPLQHFSPYVSDVLWISASDLTLFHVEYARSVSLHVPLLHVASHVTMLLKTLNRLDMVSRAVSSARAMYPGMPVIIADDSARSDAQIASVEQSVVQYFPRVHLINDDARMRAPPPLVGSTVFIRLPFDVGLSAGRNRMVSQCRTPFFLLLDDDHVLDSHTDLGFLLYVMLASDYFDLLALQSPMDTAKWGFEFQGTLRIENATMMIEAGAHGTRDGCEIVDIAHNKFLARTSTVKRVQWEPRLKLGEHEEFFWRVKANGLHVGVCPSTSVQHRQPPHWLKRTAYDVQRSRVYAFFEIMLRIQNLQCLRTLDQSPICRSPEYSHFTADTQVCAIGFTGSSCAECARGFHGLDCDQCSAGFFSSGCVECGCTNPDTVCDDGRTGSGQCRCRCAPHLGPNLLLATPHDLTDGLAQWKLYTKVRGGMPLRSGRVVRWKSDEPQQPTFRISNRKAGLHSGLYRTITLTPPAEAAQATQAAAALASSAVSSASLSASPFEVVFSAVVSAEDVSGEDGDSNFSIYIDAWYADDGMPEWGKFIPLPSGTYRHKRIEAAIAWPRPIKQMTVHLLMIGRRGRCTFTHIAAHVRSCDCGILVAKPQHAVPQTNLHAAAAANKAANSKRKQK